MKFRIRYADQVVGAFIIVAMAFLCVIIILLGMNQRWFSKNYNFTTRFESSAGVTRGMSIVMRGFPVGKIVDFSPDERNRLDVKFVIFDTYYPKVKENSLVEMSVSPIGLGTQILFHPGKGETLIPDGSYIPEASSEQGQAIVLQELAEIPPKDDTVTRLLANVNPLLENVNRTLVEVNKAFAGTSTGPLGKTILQLPDTVAGVNSVLGNVNGIAATANAEIEGLLDQVELVVASVQGIAMNLEETSAALRDPTGLVPKLLDPKGSIATLLDDKNVLFNKITSMLTEIEKSVKSLSAISSSLNAEMPKIAAILNESRTALQKAQDVLEGLKNNPLIKGGIPERTEQQSLYQSMRGGAE